ncbi:radical SAM protein [Candidatus Woesearchaeota archaeon]|nr:radical SAM protein [Candidatus Woesearchaeota archaeon]
MSIIKAIKKTKSLLSSCTLCPRRCRVNRLKGEKGFCRAKTQARIFGSHVHYGEEPELVPSGTLFFAGCTMHCVYCQNAPASVNPELGEGWSDKKIGQWINKISKKCKNINFVSPDAYLLNIAESLKYKQSDLPVVWNSSSYYSEDAADILKEFVDIYLLDFRYFSQKCSDKYSNALGYVKAAKKNHIIAKKHGKLIVRLLILPDHIDCCAKPILKWIRNNLGKDTRINIMDQYYPCYKAEKYPEIDRRLRTQEYIEVLKYARSLGLVNTTCN